jgi:hypothetical protein
MDRSFGYQDSLGTRFQSAQVTQTDGSGVYGLTVAGASSWSEVGQAVDVDIPVGGTALVVSAGASDNPQIVGQDSWITG